MGRRRGDVVDRYKKKKKDKNKCGCSGWMAGWLDAVRFEDCTLLSVNLTGLKRPFAKCPSILQDPMTQ